MPHQSIQRSWPWAILVISFMVAVLASVALVVAVNQEHSSQAQFIHLAEQGKEAHDGVCALKVDLHQRVIDGYKYLAKHPDGAPALGLSRKALLRSIGNEQRTLVALKTVNC